MPSRPIRRNVRFYFTERGWDTYGRQTCAAMTQAKMRYRVIAREEHDRTIDVVYRDWAQVAIRPRKPRP